MRVLENREEEKANSKQPIISIQKYICPDRNWLVTIIPNLSLQVHILVWYI
jgi:hypothetical protein